MWFAPSLIQMTFIMPEGLRQMTFILPRLGDYGVSIIHINSSTIAISIVEPQNDADTFINSCGETGERPAIRVMITIHDARATVRLADIDEKVRNITIDVAYSDDENDFNLNKIVLALAKKQIDDIKRTAALDTLRGLNRFAADTGLSEYDYTVVITAATSYAKEEGLSLTEYLAAFAINDAGIMDDGVIDDD